MYNNERLTYVAFDFNEYCAGMKFDNVQVLLKELQGTTFHFIQLLNISTFSITFSSYFLHTTTH